MSLWPFMKKLYYKKLISFNHNCICNLIQKISLYMQCYFKTRSVQRTKINSTSSALFPRKSAPGNLCPPTQICFRRPWLRKTKQFIYLRRSIRYKTYKISDTITRPFPNEIYAGMSVIRLNCKFYDPFGLAIYKQVYIHVSNTSPITGIIIYIKKFLH